MRPCAARLAVQLQIKFSDRVRRKQRVLAALLTQMPIALGLNLAVDDDVANMHALRPRA